MDENKSKVYILADEENRIVRCEGGYSIGNIKDLENWLFIDEGTGDKFNLCQAHYFEGGLYTEDGIPRYKLAEGGPVLRTAEEIQEDQAARPAPLPPASDSPTWEELAAAIQEGVNSV